MNVTCALAQGINGVFGFYSLIVFASVIMSWVRPDPTNPFVRWIRKLVEPPCQLIRRYMPFVSAGGLDFSPIVLLFGVQLVGQLLVRATGCGLM